MKHTYNLATSACLVCMCAADELLHGRPMRAYARMQSEPSPTSLSSDVTPMIVYDTVPEGYELPLAACTWHGTHMGQPIVTSWHGIAHGDDVTQGACAITHASTSTVNMFAGRTYTCYRTDRCKLSYNNISIMLSPWLLEETVVRCFCMICWLTLPIWQ